MSVCFFFPFLLLPLVASSSAEPSRAGGLIRPLPDHAVTGVDVPLFVLRRYGLPLKPGRLIFIPGFCAAGKAGKRSAELADGTGALEAVRDGAGLGLAELAADEAEDPPHVAVPVPDGRALLEAGSVGKASENGALDDGLAPADGPPTTVPQPLDGPFEVPAPAPAAAARPD